MSQTTPNATRAAARRGFTLVELMVVVAIFALLAGMALMSIGRTDRAGQLDGFSRDVQSMLYTARRRAIATRNVFLVSVVQNAGQPATWSAAYCQVTTNPDQITAAVLAALPATCPQPAPITVESVRPLVAGPGAQAAAWAKTTDTGQANVVQLPLPASVYFMPDGTVDSDLVTAGRQGFTLYLQGNENGTGNGDAQLHRKIYMLPFGGRPRVIDSW